MPPLTPHRRTGLICLAILLATLAVYWPVGRAEFLSVDDHDYISGNQTVQAGLSWNGLRWSFGGHAANWHPLTWLSLMFDCQLFGLNSAWHHRVNLLMHAATSVLLFLVLRRMTGREWTSAFVAALFALHPEHVESVAWVAERKDVLCGLFWVLTMAAYVIYVERPGWLRYALTLLAFALGLMSKQMIVTLPCVLLLLDCWPLRRQASWARLAIEKVPFLLLAAAACVATVIAQSQGGAVAAVAHLPLGWRAGNAIVSYVRYARGFLWPSNLAAFYPMLRPWPMLTVLGAAAVLAVVTAIMLLQWRRRPYLAVGWLWFLGTLVPVIGLVQVGNQAMADRYMYIPMIGLALMVAWTAAEKLQDRSLWPAAAVLIACGAVTANDVRYWHDSKSLFARSLQRTEPNVFALHSLASAKLLSGDREGAIADLEACTKLQPGNPHVRRALGYALREAKRFDEARQQLARALRIDPTDGRSWESMARLYADQGKWPQAVEHYEAAAELRPDDYDIRMALAAAHRQVGRRDAALEDLRAALKINPHLSQPWHMYGVLLLECNQPAAAVEPLSKAVALKPDNADAQYRLGLALMQSGQGSAAVAPLMAAVHLAPNSPEALSRLAWLLATYPDAHLRSGENALFLAQRASDLTKQNSPEALDALAAALAEQEQFDQAATVAKRAAKLARDGGDSRLATQIDSRASHYQSHQALRDPSLAGAHAGAVLPQ